MTAEGSADGWTAAAPRKRAHSISLDEGARSLRGGGKLAETIRRVQQEGKINGGSKEQAVGGSKSYYQHNSRSQQGEGERRGNGSSIVGGGLYVSTTPGGSVNSLLGTSIDERRSASFDGTGLPVAMPVTSSSGSATCNSSSTSRGGGRGDGLTTSNASTKGAVNPTTSTSSSSNSTTTNTTKGGGGRKTTTLLPASVTRALVNKATQGAATAFAHSKAKFDGSCSAANYNFFTRQLSEDSSTTSATTRPSSRNTSGRGPSSRNTSGRGSIRQMNSQVGFDLQDSSEDDRCVSWDEEEVEEGRRGRQQQQQQQRRRKTGGVVGRRRRKGESGELLDGKEYEGEGEEEEEGEKESLPPFSRMLKTARTLSGRGGVKKVDRWMLAGGDEEGGEGEEEEEKRQQLRRLYQEVNQSSLKSKGGGDVSALYEKDSNGRIEHDVRFDIDDSIPARPPSTRRYDSANTFSISEELNFDIDPDFDTSATHLAKLFAMLDADGNGFLTHDEFSDALTSMPGMRTIPREKIDMLFEQIDRDSSQGITQEEFISLFQHMATKALARRGLGKLMEFYVYDYGPEMAQCRCIYQKEDGLEDGSHDLDKTQVEQVLDTYFDEPIEDVQPGNVRWISITGLEPSIVVRLGNRYKLHPLQIEDVLKYHKQRMKADKAGNVLQLLVGRCVHLEFKGLPQIRKEQVTIFFLEEYHTVISIQQSPSEMNARLLARIMYAGSKIRLNGPKFLAYAIVDAIVDELFPILRQIRKRLKSLHSDVTSPQKKTSLKTIHLIQHIIREVNLLLLWLSPLGTVVARLNAELLPKENDYELKKHLGDLVDHVHAIKEQTTSMIGWAKSLNDEYLNEQQFRMNEVIYILTMTTSLILPAQFLTGVFGMNFEHFPILNDPYGFPIFWAMTTTCIVGILVVFRMKKWL